MYSRDSKGKVRVFILTVIVKGETFLITRESGLLNGKLTNQPDLVISKGNAKRTVREQAILQTKSTISKQRDKGYKLLEQLSPKILEGRIDPMDYKTIDKLLPSDKTDASGNTKPMKAKDTNVLKDADREKGTNKYDLLVGRAWWLSYKLDGIRTKAPLVDGELRFASNSGKQFKGVTTNFKHDKELIAFCEKYGCELDGEFYVHGMPLKDINGHCQKEEYIPERHDQIKFHLFDMCVEGMDATQRCKILNELKISNPRVVVVKHTYAVGKAEVEKYLQEAVDLDYEGAMGRTTVGEYEPGKKSNEMWKFKPFQDAEFTVTGISEGLREEDMCFTMITDTGVEFKASIMGDRKEKQEYRKDIDNLIGKKGTVKFQYLTPDGKPFLPKFKCFRSKDDTDTDD